MKGGSEDPFSTLFTGSITAKIGGSIMPIIDMPPPDEIGKFRRELLQHALSVFLQLPVDLFQGQKGGSTL